MSHRKNGGRNVRAEPHTFVQLLYNFSTVSYIYKKERRLLQNSDATLQCVVCCSKEISTKLTN